MTFIQYCLKMCTCHCGLDPQSAYYVKIADQVRNDSHVCYIITLLFFSVIKLTCNLLLVIEMMLDAARILIIFVTLSRNKYYISASGKRRRRTDGFVPVGDRNVS